MGKHEFEYRDETWNVKLVAVPVFYDTDARSRINNFHNEFSSTKVRLPIETLMVEIKTEVPEKLEYDNWDKSEISAFSRISGRLWTWHVNENEWFFDQYLLHNCGFLDSEPNGRNQTGSVREKGVWISNREVAIVKAVFGNFGQSGLWRKAQNHQFSNELFWMLYNVSFWDLNEWIELCTFGEKAVAI